MVPLPFVDEHSIALGASPEATWAALLRVVRASFAGEERFAGLLGSDPARSSAGWDGSVGQTLPGFAVVESEPGRRLVLRGRHRFSRYELAFVIDDRLRARTSAAFPGLAGRVYRAAVIGSRVHVLVVRRMLRAVSRSAARG